MESFNGALYIGMFGYGSSPSTGMVYRYTSTNQQLSEVKGLSQQALGSAESVCALKEFKGHLYAATEDKGRIFRSANGIDWTFVFQGRYPVACTLEVHKHRLYAATATHVGPNEKGEVLYTSSGDPNSWEKAQFVNNPGYIREIVSHQNKLYGFSVRGGQGLWHESSNGTTWTSTPSSALFGVNTRVFRTKSIDNSLWLGTAKYGIKDGHTGIWTLANGSLTEEYQNDEYSHITDFELGYTANNKQPVVLAAASTGFKSKPGTIGSALLIKPDNTSSWRELTNFPNEEGLWALNAHAGKIYAGTMHGGLPTTRTGFGRLIELTTVRAEPFSVKDG